MIESVKHRAAGLLFCASGHAPTLHARPLAVNICTHPLFFASSNGIVFRKDSH